MKPKFEVSGRINKPVDEVFEAVVNPDELSAYFTTGGARGRLETGATVIWAFHDCPGEFPVQVVEVETNKRITFQWGSDVDGGESLTTVTMRFEALEGGRTLVSIAEEGWPESDPGFKASYGNCMGWTQMMCALKAWIEHGINLREGMFE